MGSTVYGWNPAGEDHERGVGQRQVGHGQHPGRAWRDGATGTCVSKVTVILLMFRHHYVMVHVKQHHSNGNFHDTCHLISAHVMVPTYFVTVFFIQEQNINKKVLRERKRHTECSVSSTPYAVLSWGGGG